MRLGFVVLTSLAVTACSAGVVSELPDSGSVDSGEANADAGGDAGAPDAGQSDAGSAGADAGADAGFDGGALAGDGGVDAGALANAAPVVNAGVDQTVSLTQGASLTGIASDDGRPSPPATLTTAWSVVTTPAGASAQFADPTALSTTVQFTAAGLYVLRLTADDSQRSATDDLTVTVQSASGANQAPVINSNGWFVVAFPAGSSSASLTLAPPISDDGLPNPPAALTYTWTVLDTVPPLPVLSSTSTASTTITVTAAGSYHLGLRVSDGSLSTTIPVRVVALAANGAPNVWAGFDATTSVGLAFSLSGRIADEGLPAPATLTSMWSVVSGPAGASFRAPTSTTTAVTFTSAGTYVLRLTASDGALTTSDDVSVVVNAAGVPLPPAKPTHLVAAPTGVTTATITWRDNANNETGYKVYGTTSLLNFNTGVLPLLTTLPAGSTSYTATNLPAGARGFYRVAATNAGGDSDFSNIGATGGTGGPYPLAAFDFTEATFSAVPRTVRIAFPTDVTVVRGVLMNAGGAGGDTRVTFTQAWYDEFLHLTGFAYAGTFQFSAPSFHGNPSYEPIVVALDALANAAAESGHPELNNAPFAFYGFSAGAAFACGFLANDPSRVIAVSPVSTPCPSLSAGDAALEVPVLANSGDMEARVLAGSQAAFTANRALGGKTALLTLPFDAVTMAGTHVSVGQEVLGLPFLADVIAARYPPGVTPLNARVPLRAVSETSGWLVDPSTAHSGLLQSWAYAQAPGNPRALGWVPNAGIATIFRAYGTYSNPLAIVTPAPGPAQPPVVLPGAAMTFTIDDSGFTTWASLSLLDRESPVSTLTTRPGGPITFTVNALMPGLHVFSVVGVSGTTQRTSAPVMVVVRSLVPPVFP